MLLGFFVAMKRKTKLLLTEMNLESSWATTMGFIWEGMGEQQRRKLPSNTFMHESPQSKHAVHDTNNDVQ